MATFTSVGINLKAGHWVDVAWRHPGNDVTAARSGVATVIYCRAVVTSFRNRPPSRSTAALHPDLPEHTALRIGIAGRDVAAATACFAGEVAARRTASLSFIASR